MIEIRIDNMYSPDMVSGDWDEWVPKTSMNFDVNIDFEVSQDGVEGTTRFSLRVLSTQKAKDLTNEGDAVHITHALILSKWNLKLIEEFIEQEVREAGRRARDFTDVCQILARSFFWEYAGPRYVV